MEQKRKIIIPLGGSAREATATPSPNYDGGMTVPAPLFDEEATLGAQPVVPLAKASPVGPGRLPLIALLIVIAVGAGIAGGFAIGVYRSRQNRPTATAATATTTTTASSGSTAQTSAPQQQLPVIASEKSPEPPARTTAAAADATTERTSARDNRSKTDDEQEVIPPVEIRSSSKERREAKIERAGGSKDDDDERVAKRQKKERRRRARETDEQDADLNRRIERAGQEVNRIREIFEGQRP